MPHYSLLDRVIRQFDTALKTIHGVSSAAPTTRPYPGAGAIGSAAYPLTPAESRKAACLMRINHVGEVCAQALYQGQTLTARDPTIQAKLTAAAQQETDHLAWCEQRLTELNSRVSYLNPLWYFGSLTLGIAAGLAGDAINLGFLAETEHQVEQHLTDQLSRLPPEDRTSRLIVEQMRTDEAHHALLAEQAGATELPFLVKHAMRLTATLMKMIAYWI